MKERQGSGEGTRSNRGKPGERLETSENHRIRQNSLSRTRKDESEREMVEKKGRVEPLRRAEDNPSDQIKSRKQQQSKK